VAAAAADLGGDEVYRDLLVTGADGGVEDAAAALDAPAARTPLSMGRKPTYMSGFRPTNTELWRGCD
jgi:hypothetical protein